MKNRILIVDDEPDVRMVCKSMLVAEGFDIVEAGSGKEALDMLKKDKDIDLVLLDIMMPKMDGLHTAHEIRKKHKALPIIIVTVKDDDITKGMAKRLYGVDYYITKPFHNKMLIDSVKKVLKLK